MLKIFTEFHGKITYGLWQHIHKLSSLLSAYELRGLQFHSEYVDLHLQPNSRGISSHLYRSEVYLFNPRNWWTTQGNTRDILSGR